MLRVRNTNSTAIWDALITLATLARTNARYKAAMKNTAEMLYSGSAQSRRDSRAIAPNRRVAAAIMPTVIAHAGMFEI